MPHTTPNDDIDSLPLVTLPASASTPSPTSAYLRQAKPSDIPALAAVYARAFARDPQMNWFGGVRALVPMDYDHDHDHNDGNDKGTDNARATARRTLKALRHFQLVLVRMALILGLVVVVVERCEDETKPDGKEGEEKEKERIVGGAMWLRPGTSMDPSPLTFVRISPWRSLWNWGIGGFKRTTVEYAPKVEKIIDKEFAARGLKRLDSWHLFEIAIDPTCEGKGYCSLLVRDGLKRAAGKPVHLEATTPRSRDVYAHFGFELNEERRFGVGSVDEMGIAAKGKAAIGWPIFIMTKWENP
ncbi:hypothetical protein BJV74DRAFT_884319 [Russula compacta]|nr:hypothetical protein BJV74DRAFT_884319 [Russula compacta]